MKKIALACYLLFMTTGCGAAVLGGAAAGGYMVGTDERSAGSMLDDSAITTKVNLRLIEDAAVKARQIDVDTLEGVVYLTGVVASKFEADRAIDITRTVPGVRQVVNNLQIGSKTINQAMSDKHLGIKIKTAMVREPGIQSMNVDVDVNRGVVTLTGKVHSQAQKNRVIEIARTTYGTVKVVDNITVLYP